MMNQAKPRESEMLGLVRRWRKEAYEERQRLTELERAAQLRKLADQLGLEVVERARTRRR